MHFDNVQESREQIRRKSVGRRRAYSDGVHAFHAGRDGLLDNPHGGWEKSHLKQHSEQCVLWASWLRGWLDEYYRGQCNA